MKTKRTWIFAGGFFILSALFLTSCSKNKKEVSYFQSNLELNVQEKNQNYTEEKTYLHPDSYSGKTIAVFFGYGCNDEAFYESSIEILSRIFGLKDDGGIIYPILFPSDLHNRISSLYILLSELELDGIIILGAPEKTHAALARLQDDWNLNEPFSIFSFCPQDDILGQEAESTFILDYERQEDENLSSSESGQKIDRDLQNILVNAVRYMTELPAPIAKDKNLPYHVQNIVGNKKIRRYVDSETGLVSSNHFILEREKQQ